LGVNLDGILFYENEKFKRCIKWKNIQKLKYRERSFFIEYLNLKSVENLNSSNQWMQSTTTETFKLDHFRISKDLYFTCICHHAMFKKSLENFRFEKSINGIKREFGGIGGG